ncbi:MAG: TraR/DksA family transcriptional regulator [Planctomycetota bacterium]
MAKKPKPKAAKKAAKARKTAKSATQKVVKKARASVKTKATKKVVKRSVKKTAKKTAKKAAKKVAKKAAKKAAKKTTKKANPSAKGAKRLKKARLSKSQLNEFKKVLLAKRRDLIGDMNGIEAEAFRSGQGTGGDLSSMPTHPADIGTDNYEHEFTLGLLESERNLLTEIDDALQRVVGGTFGICIGTGEPIDLPRLKARPWAKYGIEYARMLEQGLVTPADDNRFNDDQEEEDTDEADEDSENIADDVDKAGVDEDG